MVAGAAAAAVNELQDELPPEFDAYLNAWYRADRDAQMCLVRYQISPTFVTRLAVSAAYAALEAAIGTLKPWTTTHPRIRVARVVDYAQSSWNGLHVQMERAGLLRDWGTDLLRH
jgi:hypothetical protein